MTNIDFNEFRVAEINGEYYLEHNPSSGKIGICNLLTNKLFADMIELALERVKGEKSPVAFECQGSVEPEIDSDTSESVWQAINDTLIRFIFIGIPRTEFVDAIYEAVYPYLPSAAPQKKEQDYE